MKVEIVKEEDVVAARQAARQAVVAYKFSLVDQTRIITAVSELARNILLYAVCGWMEYHEVSGPRGKKGLEFVFQDYGPGIIDIDLAMTPGYSTGNGLGLGLSGARRLMDDFAITSHQGEGTIVRITKWLN
ncbi:ATP-binding protein [Pelosinus sp. sgz500959]|uniref:ATP-binding protein n=1 Tax=Pelosinus sp. sgz500959 TaxID=3242472 RepID=UPI00366ADE4B